MDSAGKADLEQTGQREEGGAFHLDPILGTQPMKKN